MWWLFVLLFVCPQPRKQQIIKEVQSHPLQRLRPVTSAEKEPKWRLLRGNVSTVAVTERVENLRVLQPAPRGRPPAPDEFQHEQKVSPSAAELDQNMIQEVDSDLHSPVSSRFMFEHRSR